MSQNEFEKWALFYREQLNWNPIPIYPDTKRPIYHWKTKLGLHERLCTLEEIKQWWREHPNAHIAIITGKISNVIVMDYDTPEALGYMREKGDVISVCSQSSKPYKQHHYFHHPGKDVPNVTGKQNRNGMEIDIKGDGGIIVAPPSRHKSGRKYKWIRPPKKYDIKPLDQWHLEYIYGEGEWYIPKKPKTEFTHKDPALDKIRGLLDFGKIMAMYGPVYNTQGMKLKCPWHPDGKTYNLHNYGDSGYCFTCGKTYDVFDILMIQGRTFPEALETLAREAGVEIPEKRSTIVEIPVGNASTDDEEEKKVEKLDLKEEEIIYVEKDKTKLNAFNLQEWIKEKYHVISINGGSMFNYNGKCYEPLSSHKIQHIASSHLGDYKDLFNTYQCNQFRNFLLNESYVNELQDKNFLSLDNCLFNLETSEIAEHTPYIFTLNALPFNYEPDAECPLWLQYVESTFNNRAELIEYAQEIMGYSLYKGLPVPVLFFFIGPPGSGKSTFLDTVTMLIGEKNMSALSLTDFRREFGRAQLYGKLINVCGETVTHKLLETAELKSATSGDWISAAFKYQDEFHFKPYAKNYIAMNDFPKIIDDTFALWDRIYFLKFDNRFRGTDQEIMEISRKFGSELSGIFNWALVGLNRLRDNGWKFTVPSRIESFKEQMKRSNDPVYAFVYECLIGDTGNKVLFSEAYDAYARYTEQNFGKLEVLSKRKFGKRVTEDCGKVTERGTGNHVYVVNVRWSRDARDYV